MKIKPFELERYFAKYEFTAPYLLSPSDCEPLTLRELLSMADEDSLRLWEKLRLGYTESQGHPTLREEVAKLYPNITQDDVLIIAPEEGIFIAMNVLLEANDHVVVTYPSYQSLYEIARFLGCEVSKWTSVIKGDSWKFRVQDLQTLIRPNTKLIVFNFPHNPTGTSLTGEEFDQILDTAKKRGIMVFSDEMYRFLEYSEQDRLPSACELYDNAICLFGMSKTFALAGLRIGWLVTKDKNLLQKCAIFKDYTTICSSAPSEILAIVGLRAKEKIIERNLLIIKENLKHLEAFFTRHSDLFEWLKPKAGTIAFPKLKITKDIEKFCTDVMEKKGIMILPSSVYNFDGSYFRVGFGRRNFSEALGKLEEYLKEN